MNVEIKKHNGIVFTPEWVADFMIDEVLNGKKIMGDEKILIFATIAAEKLSKLLGKKIEKVIEENIYSADISEEYIEKTKRNLQKLSKDKIKKIWIIINFCRQLKNHLLSFCEHIRGVIRN